MIKEVDPKEKYKVKEVPKVPAKVEEKKPEEPKKEEVKMPQPLKEAPAGPFQNANKIVEKQEKVEEKEPKKAEAEPKSKGGVDVKVKVQAPQVQPSPEEKSAILEVEEFELAQLKSS